MNNLTKTSLYFGVLMIIIPSFSYANCSNPLGRNLSLGMKGADVKVLQQFLNDFPDNQIALTGVNSKGKESGVFDNATLKAFKTFQTKNADLILKPAGVSKATGFVGKYSRTVINDALCAGNGDALGYNSDMTEAEVMAKFNKDIDAMKSKLGAISTKIDTSTSGGISLSTAKMNLEAIKARIDAATGKSVTMDSLAKQISDEIGKEAESGKVVKIKSILPISPKTGDTMYVFATNLLTTNILHIGDKVFPVSPPSQTDKYIKFIVPSSISSGSHSVYLENTTGKSEKISLAINNVTTSLPASSVPKITSISPTRGNVGTTVTINGEKFTKNNTIHTTSKSYYNVVSADGKTLKFVIEADKSLLGNGTKLISQLPFTFFVRNEYGDSNVEALKLE